MAVEISMYVNTPFFILSKILLSGLRQSYVSDIPHRNGSACRRPEVVSNAPVTWHGGLTWYFVHG